MGEIHGLQRCHDSSDGTRRLRSPQVHYAYDPAGSLAVLAYN